MRKLNLFYLAVTLFLNVADTYVAAQTPLPPLTSQQTGAIDSFIADQMTKQHIPGLELGVYSRGRLLLTRGYGLANVELSAPVKPETLFQSGSVGKQFVSAAIMMLVEDGKLSLDDSIAKYFPSAPSTWKPILVKNLLSHTSGLAEYEADELTGHNGPFYLRLDFTEPELLTKIEALKPESAPGEKYDYRNTNYVLLGILIHQLTGKPYADFLAERIFKPLGMSSTRPISEHDIVPNRSSGYVWEGGQLKNQDWVSPTFNSTADGTLYFNVLDLARWDEALYNSRLLKQASLDRMWTVYSLNNGKPNSGHYGFGWQIVEQNKHRLIAHTGAWQGFTCAIARYPEDSLTVTVLTNLDAGHAQPQAIARVIAGLVVPALLPPRLVAIEDTQPALADKLRAVLDDLAAGDDLHAQTSPELAALMTPETVAEARTTLARVWPGGILTLVRRVNDPTAPAPVRSTWRLTKGKESLLVNYGLGTGGKIVTLGVNSDREYQ